MPTLPAVLGAGAAALRGVVKVRRPLWCPQLPRRSTTRSWSTSTWLAPTVADRRDWPEPAVIASARRPPTRRPGPQKGCLDYLAKPVDTSPGRTVSARSCPTTTPLAAGEAGRLADRGSTSGLETPALARRVVPPPCPS